MKLIAAVTLTNNKSTIKAGAAFDSKDLGLDDAAAAALIADRLATKPVDTAKAAESASKAASALDSSAVSQSAADAAALAAGGPTVTTASATK